MEYLGYRKFSECLEILFKLVIYISTYDSDDDGDDDD